ncbi:hypothetical protein [Accumulibacter sp.]|uniref:hypothetical protein n=1 Tax=Accumulibacter sp. TaxID=2053492 RepID=UPI0025FD4170|nr:hypothetical protein [Accumulibacter sp.]MCM8595788.1 hypothetical protein [Accumulibacter sp.]MCM8626509.1 hypothetical protein [Accumulibacter sp.]MDS4049936.1 hypothetical protein [Accumulibacter sp.]
MPFSPHGLAALAVVLALAGCFPEPEKVGDLAKTSMQQNLQRDPRFRAAGAEVLAVRVISGSDKRFEALASIACAGKTHEVPVTIVVDGLNLEWFAGADAFAFLPSGQPSLPERIPR